MSTYYVRQDGKDHNDGSVDDAAHAWHCLRYACSQLSAGDTLNIQGVPWVSTNKHAPGAADASWSDTTTFTSATATFQTAGVQAGDYLFAFDPLTDQYRSWIIASVTNETTLVTTNAAAGSGTAVASGGEVGGGVAVGED